MQEQLDLLNQDPANWEARCAVCQSLYETEQYAEAASILSEAPEIPGDEESLLFSAAVFGAVDPEAGHSLLDQVIDNGEGTPALHEMKAQLFEMSGDAEAAAAQRALAEGSAGSAPAAVAPRSLRPPGEEETPSSEEASPPATVVAPPAEVAADAALAGSQVVEESDERGLVVGEGEAIHAAERASDTKEKANAVLIAVIAHAVIIAGLIFWTVASPQNPPPQISVSSLAKTDDAALESQTMTKMQQKTASATASSQPVISSAAFSNFAMPEITDMSTPMMTMGASDTNAQFGMSMTGFGDVSNMSAIPAGMRSRCSMSERMKRLRESGGADEAERAVRDGLAFLSELQNEDGSFGKHYYAGMTGLTLLAYLGHCETPESPKFGESVVNAALYLMDRASKNDGLITNGEKGHHESYEHAIGTYALAELYTMTKESGKEIPRLESVLRKAVGVITDAQLKDGGWDYYGRTNSPDMSVSGWNIQALKAAHNTGRKFSGVTRALDDAIEDYLPSIQDSKGAFKYRRDNPAGKPTLTGAALLGLQMWDGMDTDTYRKGLAFLSDHYKNPNPGNNYYAPYYNTQVFFMHEGQEWIDYNSKFQPRLLAAQNDDGSWTNDGGRDDNRIMNTAWAILMLEVYYRYLPTTDKVQDLNVR
ncbi:MAG: hypothetical protein AAF357_13465 [Verrucomicrobiota bacterium]